MKETGAQLIQLQDPRRHVAGRTIGYRWRICGHIRFHTKPHRQYLGLPHCLWHNERVFLCATGNGRASIQPYPSSNTETANQWAAGKESSTSATHLAISN